MRRKAIYGACGLLFAGLAILGSACIGTAESALGEAAEPMVNMTPNEEPVGEAAQEIGFCGCSTESDWCYLWGGGKCVANFNKCIKVAHGCGVVGTSPCNGECVRP